MNLFINIVVPFKSDIKLAECCETNSCWNHGQYLWQKCT